MINRLLRVDFIVFFTNVIGFIVMVMHTFAPDQYESLCHAEQLVSELLFIHITVAILSYGHFHYLLFFRFYIYSIQFTEKEKMGKEISKNCRS